MQTYVLGTLATTFNQDRNTGIAGSVNAATVHSDGVCVSKKQGSEHNYVEKVDKKVSLKKNST